MALKNEEATCLCAFQSSEKSQRVEKWRELCTIFFFHQDPWAKRILEHFESDQINQIIIQTTDEVLPQEEKDFLALISFLGLKRCLEDDHKKYLDETINTFEKIKNEVRSSFHRQAAQKRFHDFEAHLNCVQGTSYEAHPDNRSYLIVRSQHGYQRTLQAQARMVKGLQQFVSDHIKNIGCHPFLLGLHQTFTWNLESPHIVGWHVSDAVFVESGGNVFSSAALNLLVTVLNFGHCKSSVMETTCQTGATIHHRIWHVDPYLSNTHLRELVGVLPDPRRLEGKATGERIETCLERGNVDGQHDEPPPFIMRWCTIL